MKNLKLLCGAALLVAASGVQAEIVSMNDMELTEVNGQLGYFDTTHKIVELLGPAHTKVHAVDDAIQAHVGAHVDVAQAAAAAVVVHVGGHVSAAKEIKQEIKTSVISLIGTLAAHHAGHHM